MLDGFKDEHFNTNYQGKYSIEIHKKINAINLPIKLEPMACLSELINCNTEDIFRNTEFLKFDNYYYVADDWKANRIKINGKVYLCVNIILNILAQ